MKKIDRIVANLPEDKVLAINALKVLIHLAKGEKEYMYSVLDGRITLGLNWALLVLDAAGIDYQVGGYSLLGKYVKLSRRILSAIPVLQERYSSIS